MLSDLPAERAVLSGIFQYGEDCYLDVSDIIQPSTFTDDTNQAIYKCFVHLFSSGATTLDQSSVMGAASELSLQHIFTQPNEAQYVRTIFNSHIDKSNVVRWAAKIRKLEIARLLKNQLNAASNGLGEITGSEPIEEILGIAENKIFDFTSLLHNDSNSPVDITHGLEERLDNLESNPVEIMGVSSGMPYYDAAIGGGFRRKTVSLIGARPKVGKSMLAANIALHVAKTIDIPVLFLDTEMTLEDQQYRMLSNRAWHKKQLISIDQIETGQYSRNNSMVKVVRQCSKELKQHSIIEHINVSGSSFEEIVGIMRRWILKKVGYDENGNTNPCLIIYDYLKLMSGEGVSDSLREYQLLGFMTTLLHNFAVKHDVPILAMIQLNRDGIDKESSAAFAQSDRILWLVTNYSIFKYKDEEDRAETGPQNGNRKMIPLSARHGPGMSDDDYINVHMHGQYGVIKEGQTKSNLANGDKPPEVNLEERPKPFEEIDLNDDKDSVQ